MQSMKIGNGTAIHIRNSEFDHLAPLCGGARVNGPAQAKRIVESAPTCKACLKKLAKIEAEFHATPNPEEVATEEAAQAEEGAMRTGATEECDRCGEQTFAGIGEDGKRHCELCRIALETAQQEREEIARTLPNGDLEYWIASEKTAKNEPEQHAAFVAERARRVREDQERNEEYAAELAKPLSATRWPRGFMDTPLPPTFPTAQATPVLGPGTGLLNRIERALNLGAKAAGESTHELMQELLKNYTPACDCGTPFTCRTHG